MKKILIIEDDKAQNQTLQLVLKKNGYETDQAYSGAEGIQKAFAAPPNLILCDINMNGLDGYKVLSILKDSSSTASIPFIFISGLNASEDLRLGMEMGADDYIVKPFKNRDLIFSIKKRLERFESIKDKQEEEFEKFIQFSPHPIAVFIENKIHFTNAAFNDLIRIAPSEISLIDFDALFSSDKQKFLEQLESCSRGLDAQQSFSVRLHSTDGITIPTNVHICQSKLFYNHTSILALFVPHTNNTYTNLLKQDILTLLEVNKENIPPQFKEQLENILHNNSEKESHTVDKNDVQLTVREKEVLKLTLQGDPIKIIADKLNISMKTAEKHRINLLRKTNTPNAVALVMYAIRNKLT